MSSCLMSTSSSSSDEDDDDYMSIVLPASTTNATSATASAAASASTSTKRKIGKTKVSVTENAIEELLWYDFFRKDPDEQENEKENEVEDSTTANTATKHVSRLTTKTGTKKDPNDPNDDDEAEGGSTNEHNDDNNDDDDEEFLPILQVISISEYTPDYGEEVADDDDDNSKEAVDSISFDKYNDTTKHGHDDRSNKEQQIRKKQTLLVLSDNDITVDAIVIHSSSSLQLPMNNLKPNMLIQMLEYKSQFRGHGCGSYCIILKSFRIVGRLKYSIQEKKLEHLPYRQRQRQRRYCTDINSRCYTDVSFQKKLKFLINHYKTKAKREAAAAAEVEREALEALVAKSKKKGRQPRKPRARKRDTSTEEDDHFDSFLNTHMGSDKAAILANTICKQMKNLVISEFLLRGNELGSDGTKYIMSALRQSCSTIRHLDLSENNITYEAMAPIAIYLLQDTSKSLQELILDTNPLGYNGALILSSVLGNSSLNPAPPNPTGCTTVPVLQKLHLNNVCIEVRGAALLGEMLKTNTSITILELGFNNLGDDGIIGLATGLWQNQTLETLNVRNTSIGNTGISYLANVLKYNIGLQRLDIYNNGSNVFNNAFDETGALAMYKSFEYNNTLRTLLLDPEPEQPDRRQRRRRDIDDDEDEQIVQQRYNNEIEIELRDIFSNYNDKLERVVDTKLPISIRKMIAREQDYDDDIYYRYYHAPKKGQKQLMDVYHWLLQQDHAMTL